MLFDNPIFSIYTIKESDDKKNQHSIKTQSTSRIDSYTQSSIEVFAWCKQKWKSLQTKVDWGTHKGICMCTETFKKKKKSHARREKKTVRLKSIQIHETYKYSQFSRQLFTFTVDCAFC